MRFKITFNRTGKQRMLPMDYQYFLSAWIYKVIDKADPQFSAFLHSEGYTSGNKRFKYFCYSPLDFGRFEIWKEKTLFEILQDEITLQVSFLLPDAAEKFIIGLFNNQQLFIGDRFNGIDLIVKQIERMPDSAQNSIMHYRSISPVVISFKKDESRYANYLSPIDNNYSSLLRQNLWNKYLLIPGKSELTDDFNFVFKLNSTPRSKLVTIKPYTPDQSKVRGFIYDFTLNGPTEIHQLILSSGIGEKNSMGFGWCEFRK